MDFYDVTVAARAVLDAYDNARAVCCHRCEHEPEGAIWVDSVIDMQGPTLADAIERLRALLED